MVCPLTRRSCARWDRNRSIHSRSAGSTWGYGSTRPGLGTHQRVGHELADARQKFRTHGRVESLRIARADGQNSQLAFGAQWSESHRADLDRVLAEKIIALRIADLSATRLAGLEQRFESLDIGVGGVRGTQEPAR